VVIKLISVSERIEFLCRQMFSVYDCLLLASLKTPHTEAYLYSGSDFTLFQRTNKLKCNDVGVHCS